MKPIRFSINVHNANTMYTSNNTLETVIRFTLPGDPLYKSCSLAAFFRREPLGDWREVCVCVRVGGVIHTVCVDGGGG